MEAYRDQYAKLFNNGRHVVVLAVSVDADTTLAAVMRLNSVDFPTFGRPTMTTVGITWDMRTS